MINSEKLTNIISHDFLYNELAKHIPNFYLDLKTHFEKFALFKVQGYYNWYLYLGKKNKNMHYMIPVIIIGGTSKNPKFGYDHVATLKAEFTDENNIILYIDPLKYQLDKVNNNILNNNLEFNKQFLLI